MLWEPGAAESRILQGLDKKIAFSLNRWEKGMEQEETLQNENDRYFPS